jgi:hypothetical protein
MPLYNCNCQIIMLLINRLIKTVFTWPNIDPSGGPGTALPAGI